MLLGALLSTAACCALAESPGVSAGTLAVAELGRLNGIALACKQPALTTRLREIVIAVAPKVREIGEKFEQATSQSFLAQVQQNQPCPEGKALAASIDTAEAALKRAFPKTP